MKMASDFSLVPVTFFGFIFQVVYFFFYRESRSCYALDASMLVLFCTSCLEILFVHLFLFAFALSSRDFVSAIDDGFD